MARPYEAVTKVTTTGANEIVTIGCPDRVQVTKMVIVREGGGAITADFYNRAFTAAAVNLATIVDDGSGKAKVIFQDEHRLQVGDTLTVAGASPAGYNTDHEVVTVVNKGTVVTDQAYISTGTGGTGSLNIPAEEHPLYQVLPQQTGTGSLIYWPTEFSPFVSQDPEGATSLAGQSKKLYVKLADIDTYRIALAAASDMT